MGGVTVLCMVVVVKVGAMNARSARRHRKQKKEKEGRTRPVKLAPMPLCGKKVGKVKEAGLLKVRKKK